MFPTSWHLSLTGRKHYALLFADDMDRIQAETIHPLLSCLYDKQFHSHENSPPSSSLLQYFHSEIFSYRKQLQHCEHCSLAIHVMQNTLKDTEYKISRANTSVGLTLIHSIVLRASSQSWKRSTAAMKSANKFQIKRFPFTTYVILSCHTPAISASDCSFYWLVALRTWLSSISTCLPKSLLRSRLYSSTFHQRYYLSYTKASLCQHFLEIHS